MANNNTPLAARWATATEVLDRLAKVKTIRETQQALLGRLDGQVRNRETELESTLGDIPHAQRLSIVSRATASFRQETRANSAKERTRLMVEAVEHDRMIAGAAAHYKSPIQMLMRESLGSERRGRIHQQIEQSGPAELAALAEYAAGTKDLELAAALCSRNATIKSAQRQFSSSDLADALLGAQHREVADAVREIQALTQEVINDDRAFGSGRSNPTDKMSVALHRRGEPQVEQ